MKLPKSSSLCEPGCSWLASCCEHCHCAAVACPSVDQAWRCAGNVKPKTWSKLLPARLPNSIEHGFDKCMGCSQNERLELRNIQLEEDQEAIKKEQVGVCPVCPTMVLRLSHGMYVVSRRCICTWLHIHPRCCAIPGEACLPSGPCVIGLAMFCTRNAWLHSTHNLVVLARGGSSISSM